MAGNKRIRTRNRRRNRRTDIDAREYAGFLNAVSRIGVNAQDVVRGFRDIREAMLAAGDAIAEPFNRVGRASVEVWWDDAEGAWKCSRPGMPGSLPLINTGSLFRSFGVPPRLLGGAGTNYSTVRHTSMPITKIE